MRGFSQLDDRLFLFPIVIILACVVVPGVHDNIEKAKQESCLKNSHGVGRAILLYVQDYDEQFPTGRMITANRSHSIGAGVGWAGGICSYLDYIDDLHCPGDPTAISPAAGTIPALYPVSYSYNRNLVDDRSRGSAKLSSLSAPAVTVMLAEVKGNLANVVSSSELPSSSAPTYSSAGDGINYLYWNDQNDNALFTGDIQYDGGLPAEFHCNDAPHPPSGCKGYTATNGYAGRHNSGGIYCLIDGHARYVKSGGVSAGMNAISSDTGQTFKRDGVYAAGTAARGRYEVTYSTK